MAEGTGAPDPKGLPAEGLDRAYGAVLGACVGDAAGAVLEFKLSVSPEQVSF